MRPLRLLACLAVLLPAASGGAQAPDPVHQRLADCAAVTSLLDRLRCFDQMARDSREKRDLQPAAPPAAAGPGPAPAEGTSRWRRSERRNDDGKVVSMKLEADGETDIAGSARRGRPVLSISCSEDGMQIWVDAPAPRPNQQSLVNLQMGREKALTQRWAYTADGRFLGLWKEGDETARRMLGQPRLRLSFGSADRPPADASPGYRFDLQGYETAVAPLRQLCVW
jgi:type VI secretion system protein VasI